MAALQCEICGGKLMAKAGGIFECDSCGMQYDKTRIQEMVQEIKGTVKVEGTVEVQGTVRLQGPVQVDNRTDAKNCALRAFQIMETRSLMSGSRSYDYNHKLREEVAGVLNEALKIDPACPEAHIGFLFREYWVSSFEELAEYAKEYAHDFRGSVYYDNAEKYSRGTTLHDQLMAAVDIFVQEKNEKDYQEAVRLMQQKGYVSAAEIFEKLTGHRDADELCRKCREEAKRGEVSGEAGVRLFRECFPASCDLVLGPGLIAAIKADGKVTVSLSEGSESYRRRFRESVAKWSDVKQICACGLGVGDRPTDALIGLTKDGRILSAGMLGAYEEVLSRQTNIAWMKSDGAYVAMVSHSGDLTVIPRIEAMYQPWSGHYMDWRNISYFQFEADGCFVAFNRKTKTLCRVKKAYYMTETVSDSSMYEDGLEEQKSVKNPGEYEDLRIINVFGQDTVHKDLADYYEDCGNNCFWAVAKNGDVLCGSMHDPKRLSIGAVALFPYVKQLEYIDRQCLFLLADGSFVDCELPDILDNNGSIQIRKIPDLQLFDGMEGLKAIKRHAEMLRDDMMKEKGVLNEELANLKGIFTGKRRKEIETRLAEIETELKGL